MSGTLATAIIAICVSLLSFGCSLYFGLRDRAKIVTRSKFYGGVYGDRPSMVFSIVNAGRRPVVIRMWAGQAATDTDWVGTYLGEGKAGLRLGEHDHHEITLHHEDLLGEAPGNEVCFADLWFEDSLVRHYPVKDAKANIALLFAAPGYSTGK